MPTSVPMHIPAAKTIDRPSSTRVKTDFDFWLRGWAMLVSWLLGLNLLCSVVLVFFSIAGEVRYQNAITEAKKTHQQSLELQKTIQRQALEFQKQMQKLSP